MTPEKFNELLSQHPFLPIKLHLNSGEIVEINDPGCTLILGATIQIFTVKQGQEHIVDNYRYIPLRNIAQVEQTAAA